MNINDPKKSIESDNNETDGLKDINTDHPIKFIDSCYKKCLNILLNVLDMPFLNREDANYKHYCKFYGEYLVPRKKFRYYGTS